MSEFTDLAKDRTSGGINLRCSRVPIGGLSLQRYIRSGRGKDSGARLSTSLWTAGCCIGRRGRDYD